MTHRFRRTSVVLLAAAFALSGCSGGGSSGASSASGAAGGAASADSNTKVNLTMWAWAPNIEQVVALWNKSHPNIQVTVSRQNAGDPAVTKLLTAIKAGKGAPDLMQAEYQAIPNMVSSNALADISGLIPADTKSHFNAGTWNAVTLGGNAVYAVPQDTGPMQFYYRADIFKKYGLSAPKTWNDYANDAKIIHEKNSKMYLGTFSSADPGEFAGLAQQAGASWWGVSGQSWKVNIDDPATQKVAQFWGGLVQQGVIDNQPQYTPAWNKGLNDGEQVGWVSAVWAPGVLAGNAGSTKGKWAMAPLPQWNAGENKTGNWGGSSTAVTSQSAHKAAAAQFAVWINTNPEAVKALATISNIYPADTVSSGAALATPPAFFANQPDFWSLTAKNAQGVQPFTYGPNVNVTYSTFNDAFAAAANSRKASDFLKALQTLQSNTVADLKKSGFSVAGS